MGSPDPNTFQRGAAISAGSITANKITTSSINAVSEVDELHIPIEDEK